MEESFDRTPLPLRGSSRESKPDSDNAKPTDSNLKFNSIHSSARHSHTQAVVVVVRVVVSVVVAIVT